MRFKAKRFYPVLNYSIIVPKTKKCKKNALFFGLITQNPKAPNVSCLELTVATKNNLFPPPPLRSHTAMSDFTRSPMHRLLLCYVHTTFCTIEFLFEVKEPFFENLVVLV